ncbi:4'-phosphopantetheinyl transferase superfamily protein [Streptomyces sp. NRRL B-1347]|uniref:4'-phosphopantetheinyl transferase superfamily protein n=1 Tax=Streptomyces sp. NRRL B-1347 TaxID=1476877 RepID=UPI0004CC5721|nr:4'-phosphopantetheinyl transferase superfamily protein [Streptomyces sp. NRRL B-1347]
MSSLVVVVDWGHDGPPHQLLGPGERHHADALPPWRKDEWTRGRLTARAALTLAGCAHYGDVLRGPGGAPRIHVEGFEGVLSIAHTGNLAACAVARPAAPVGVDIEYEQPELAELLPRITADGERATACLNPTVAWAAKEAALKAALARPGRLAAYACRPGPLTGTLIVTCPPDSGLPELTAWVTRPAGAVLVTTTATPERPQLVTPTAAEAVELIAAVSRAPVAAISTPKPPTRRGPA